MAFGGREENRRPKTFFSSQKRPPNRPFCGEKRFMSCELRGPESWTSPPLVHRFLGSLAAVYRGSLAAHEMLLSAVGGVFGRMVGLLRS